MFARAAARALAATGLIALGAAGAFVWSARHGSPAAATAALEGPRDAPAARADEPVEVTLTPEALARAAIRTAAVGSARIRVTTSLPATVTSNAYRDTRVNALVGGVATRVLVELGAVVRRGTPLAVIFSPELADAQTRYLSMRASYEADHQKLERVRELLAVGAASVQQLEEVGAIHAAHETELAAARQRLVLLGLMPAQVAGVQDATHIVSDVSVPAPGDGTVIARSVNPNQVVSAGQEMFVVADLTTVWVVGDVYEKDFPSLRVGAETAISLPAYPGLVLRGRVTYVDPRVDPQTRTARVRVEVPNPDARLKLGMFVTLTLQTGADGAVPVVPRSAVQSVGDRAVVYVQPRGDEPRFVERAVRLGQTTDDAVQVLDGLKPGERVVTDGSFFLRAEATRSGARGG